MSLVEWMNKLDGEIARGFNITYATKQNLIKAVQDADASKLAAALTPFLAELGIVAPIISALAAFLSKAGLVEILKRLPYLATMGEPAFDADHPSMAKLTMRPAKLTPAKSAPAGSFGFGVGSSGSAYGNTGLVGSAPPIVTVPKRKMQPGDFRVAYGIEKATKKEIEMSKQPRRMVYNTMYKQSAVNPTFGRAGF